MGKRIAIVGAGPAGAIALDTFIKAGFEDVTVYERRAVVGGTWNLDEHLGFEPSEAVPGIERLGEKNVDPPIAIPKEAETASQASPLKLPVSDLGPRYDESPLYPQVETNVFDAMMSWTQDPFPAIHPPKTLERFGVENAYRTQDVIRDYVRKYYAGREKYLSLNTTVERAFQPDGPHSGKWRLTFRRRLPNSKVDEWWTEDFDFLYAASGRFNVPYVPDIPGLKEAVRKTAKGTIIHTKTFRDPSLYKNKRVVLIGASFSNVDVAHLSKEAGAQWPVHVSLRNILPITVNGFAQPWIEAHSRISKISVQANGKLHLDFDDEETLDDVDVLVIGTGYLYSYPYLEEYLAKYDGIVNSDGKGTRNLYWSTWWKHDSSLAVTSNITDSLFWRLIEYQAKASAALWAKNPRSWPTLKQAEEWESARRDLDLYDFHIWYPHFTTLLNGISEVSGIELGELPDYVKLFEDNFGLKGKYWAAEAQKLLVEKPETKDQYDQTLAFLNSRVVSRF